MKMIISGLLLTLQLLIFQQAYALTDEELKIKNNEYTCAPPYLSQNAKPNINILLDLSGSMQQPAYRACSRNEPSGSFVSACTDRTVAGSELYDSTREYYGYFNKDENYKYNVAGGYFEKNSCANPKRTGSIIGDGSTGCLSGNLLNWIVTTRLDTVRKIFTGGRVKSETTTDAVLESDGAKYVVTEPDLQCTFTVSATNTAISTNSTSYAETRKLAITNQSSSKICKLGDLTAASTNVLTPLDDVSGVVHSLYNQAVLEVSVFAELSGDYRVGKSQSLQSYLDAINNELAYGATPTGTGIKQAQAFYQQANTLTASNQTVVLGKANYLKDPYYDSDGETTPTSIPVPCRKSFLLLVSDGAWPNVFTNTYPAVPSGGVGEDPAPTAHAMHTTDMQPAAGTDPLPEKQTVTVYTVYAYGDGVYGRNSLITAAIFGGYDDKYGAHSATSTTTAANGMPYPFTALPGDSRIINGAGGYPLPECRPGVRWDQECEEWDKENTGLPYNYFEGDDGAALQLAITKAVTNMLKQASSSTAASVMGNNDNSGSTLLQALFFPEKQFKSGDKATWIGELQAFWYYVDPSLNNITIREDSDSDLKLKLAEDKIAEFVFDGSKTNVNLYADTNGDGAKDTPSTPSNTLADIDDAKSLWRAGLSLWSRDTGDKRKIFTNNPKLTVASKLDFISDNFANLYEYMDTDSTQAIDIINYVRGIDVSTTYRNRTVKIDTTTNVWKLGDIIHSTPKLLSEVRLNSYNLKQPGGYSDSSYDQYIKSKDYNRRGTAYVGANDGMLHAFKLGSNFDGTTPGTVAEIKNADKSSATDLGKELWAFIPKSTLPYLQYLLLPSYQHIYMVDATPLLVDVSINPTKYTKDTTTITCTDATYSQCVKKTSVSASTGDLSYDVTSAKGGTSWRTLLLGSTGMGGAASIEQAKIKGDVNKISVTGNGKHFHCASCDFVAAGFKKGMIFKSSGFATPGNNGYFIITTEVDKNKITCADASGLKNENNVVTAVLQQITVKTPIMDPKDATKGFGYSSVFALDVTDPITPDGDYPKLLWEFSDPRLGFTTVTPAIVRIKDAADTAGLQRNGKWYAVLASGPTGPIDNGWFLGLSDKKLTIFVLDLKSGELVRTFSSAANSSTNTQFTLPVDAPAFAGSLSGSTTDTDKYKSSLYGAYSDDAVYIGYTRADSTTAPTAWDKGGVVRLLTYNDPDPANWKISTMIDGIGPVTSAVTKLQDATKSQLWLYFGTGRYYTKDDDPSNIQSLFGLKDPCFGSNNTFIGSASAPCTTTIGTSAAPKTPLDNQTTITTPDSSKSGWYINLSGSGSTVTPQRVITDTLASTNGVVFFTTFTPSKDVCSYGGMTSVWAVRYNTGGSGASKLKGQLLMQLSTGAFQQINMADAFTQSGGRETLSFKGVPPTTPPVITGNTNHFPTKRFLHIQER